MILPAYRAQVDLLLQILPYVAQESCFALKGGTAINMFVRDMPRLSVDIDLTYLPFENRGTALKNITAALGRIKDALQKAIRGIKIETVSVARDNDTKLICYYQGAQVKIEVNTIMRGHIMLPREMGITDSAQDEFKKFAMIQVVSMAELYGGKICAALDRQHPRDLFDIHHLLAAEGITFDIKRGFLSALLSHPRPINEIIKPNFLNQKASFNTEFAGMTLVPFHYTDFEITKENLVKHIFAALTDSDKKFLISFKKAEPNWALLDIAMLEEMPAIKWKLQNIRKLLQENPKKHARMLEILQSKLYQ